MAEPTSGEVPSEIRPFAALLTSKTYFYIGVLSEAVEFALKVGAALRPSLRGSIGGRSSVTGCLDRAIALTSSAPGEILDPNLQAIVDNALRSNN
ncbi:proteasome regulatory particle base subunit [Saitozyma podzolica]|uniref:Proteasome regulatory particle base subunit n=1 Tax=Saitozyma podzolica TaxID=1890683 RepID=A0A427XVX6_9TREE|nr:proteasome regulatory particle base subunit [Saitozyma podzolica]